MAKSLLKYSLKTSVVKSILYDVASNISRYYFAFGRAQPWPTDTVDGETVVDSAQDAVDSYTYELEVKSDLLLYKYVDSNDVGIIVPRKNWVAGRVYDAYDDYSSLNVAASGAESLDQADFYAMTSEFNVYKCLDNNNAGQSVVPPTGTSHESFKTSDGYTWKYMYSIPLSLRNKFLTLTYMPVVTSLTTQFFSKGSISNYTIVDKGAGYPQTRYRVSRVDVLSGGSGYTSLVLEFDQPTALDSTQALATANIIDGVVTGISVTDPGSNYIVPPSLNVVSSSPSTAGGLRYEVVYEVDNATSGDGYKYYSEITVFGDGYNSENPYSIKKIDITNRGVFTDNYSNILVFGNPQLPGRKAVVDTTMRVKSEIGGTWVAENTNVVTVTLTGHGLTNGNTYQLNFTSTSGTNATSGAYTITVVDADTFTVTNSGGTVITGAGSVEVSLFSGTWAASGTSTVTVTKASHGLSNGTYQLNFTATSGTNATSGAYTITVTGVNTFTVTNSGGAITGSGTVLVPPLRYELDDVTIVEGGFGYTVPFVVNQSFFITSAISGDTLVQPVLNFNESTQKNHAVLKPIINSSGELETIKIINPGEGYTYATFRVDHVKEQSGNKFLISSDPDSALYDPLWKPATLLTTFDVGNIVNKQSNVELLAVNGTIDYVRIENGGNGYQNGAPVSAVGDGSGFSGTITVDSTGIITKVNVIDPGSGYSNAIISVDDTAGSGSELVAVISPKGGHGKDAISELFAKTVAFSSKISNDKNQGITPTNSYRQVALIKNPKIYDSNNLFKGAIGSSCIVAVCERTAGNTATFSALVALDTLTSQGADFRLVDKLAEGDKYYLLLQPLDNVVPTSGLFAKTVNGSSSFISASSVTAPTIDKFSGEMIYLDNRSPFEPSQEQSISVLTLITF